MQIHPSSANGLTVLVIEDDPFFREVMVEALRKAGYQTLEAANGARGFEVIDHHPVDIVVTDLFMPEVEGIETIRTLRDSHPRVPILVVSGGIPGQRSDFLRMATMLGATSGLLKPFLPSELVRAVAAIAPGAAADPVRAAGD